MRYLIGVDDTDSTDKQQSPGTAALVRRLAEWLQNDHSAEPHGVTRHQLFVSKHIPYTGHNSAVCMTLTCEDPEGVWETARDFLSLESHAKSNAGLCLGSWDAVSNDVIAWGHRAKTEVVKRDEALKLAAKSRLRLAAVLGDGSGVIGALAAVGLHREGNDGRFVWLPGLMELEGSYSVAEIFQRAAIDRVCTLEEVEIPLREMVSISEWTRPLLRNGHATLYVEQTKRGWCVLDKEHIKELSS